MKAAAVTVVTLWIALACSSTSTTHAEKCQDGTTAVCECSGAPDGVQACVGGKLGPCQCGGTGGAAGANPDGGGGVGASGGSGGSAGSGATGGSGATSGSGGSAASSGGGSSGGAAGSGGVAAGSGCADSSVEAAYTDKDMVGCDGQKQQCDAVTLCDAGWHLCDFDEYVVRGGGAESINIEAWLHSCIRDVPSNDVTCPSKQICSDCANIASAPMADISYLCIGSAVTADKLAPYGVLTSKDGVTRQIGCTQAACAYATFAVSNAFHGAVCCRDPS